MSDLNDLLDEAARVVVARHGAGCRVLSVEITASTATGSTFRVPVEAAAAKATRPTARQSILATLDEATGPLKGVVLARRAKCRYSSHFRQTCADLARAGLIRWYDGGYVRCTARQADDASQPATK